MAAASARSRMRESVVWGEGGDVDCTGLAMACTVWVGCCVVLSLVAVAAAAVDVVVVVAGCCGCCSVAEIDSRSFGFGSCACCGCG